MHPKQRFAIVNGDDFGFSPGVNAAIVQAHQHGVLTSTSLMVTGAAFPEAIALAQAHPDLAVGLHLVLVCGKSALPPERIPHLVDSQGQFPDNPTQAGLRYQFSPAARQELRLEIRAQLEQFRQTGLPLAHVDGHLHLHAHPVVLDILIDLAPEFGIRVIRLPYEELRLT
ncbi:MAG: ChbG/HpnK family deacetylase, partial [Thermosynechococcaceae cyanobacterium]